MTCTVTTQPLSDYLLHLGSQDWWWRGSRTETAEKLRQSPVCADVSLIYEIVCSSRLGEGERRRETES